MYCENNYINKIGMTKQHAKMWLYMTVRLFLVKVISKLAQTSCCGPNLAAETILHNTDLSETHTHTHTHTHRPAFAKQQRVIISAVLIRSEQHVSLERQHFSYYLHMCSAFGNPKSNLIRHECWICFQTTGLFQKVHDYITSLMILWKWVHEFE